MRRQVENRVEHYRSQMGLTQEELALRLGVSRQTVNALERGNYTPSVYLALVVAECFRVPVEKIFNLHRNEKK